MRTLNELVVIPGPNAASLSKSIALLSGAALSNVHRKIFPDGEIYVRLEHIYLNKPHRALIVSSMYPNQASSFLETMLLIDASKRHGASEVIALIPYIAFSRQDKVFLSGEPISIEVILKGLYLSGASHLITADIHNPKSLREFPGTFTNVMVSDILVRESLKYVDNPIILAPDIGALERASFAAKKHGLDFDYLVKTRDKASGEVTYEPREVNLSGRNIVIVDDIISTGGTIAESTKVCLSRGALSIVVVATHSLFVGGARDRIINAGVKKIITTNTVPVIKDEAVEVIDISERLVEAIRELTES
ncbi:MAG: ribose-phosphate diphosphokinase [Sulfolobales archaeon]|nr:ribose-phosphate diphosphokinase [Sulfolobales archaeon]